MTLISVGFFLQTDDMHKQKPEWKPEFTYRKKSKELIGVWK
jgi:hypothetical protein